MFHKTPHNSMDFRCSLPPESKAKLFFNADDDLIFTCEKLMKAFEKWKKYYIGDIVPLLAIAQCPSISSLKKVNLMLKTSELLQCLD